MKIYDVIVDARWKRQVVASNLKEAQREAELMFGRDAIARFSHDLKPFRADKACDDNSPRRV